MGCSGDWVKTPALDRIATEGVRFTQCVTTTPICVPARVTLATGRYPHNNAVWNNLQYTMPPDAPTWMRTIRDLGYRTSLFGKTHLHPHRGDLREREHLLDAYGLDDVDEIGGPRASAMVMSHLTAGWEAKGLLEAYREDCKERFSNKPHVVRPSVLPLRGLHRRLRGAAGEALPRELRPGRTLVLLGELRWPARTLGRARALRQHVRPGGHARPRAPARRRPSPPQGPPRSTDGASTVRSSIRATKRPCAPTTPATSA